MKRLLFLIIICVLCINATSGQEFDLTFTGTESGTQTHVARNSITLGPGYTYTPSGGSLTVEIQNPVVTGTVAYTGTPVDPETRTLNTTSYLVGATNGSFNVNPIGGASYSVPLDILPGVNGLSPGLSLTYSSNAGPGIAGYGWQIGGLSAITRGPKTYYFDGAASGINLDINDRFYLDGQRLVNTSYTYGDASAQYQTDNDIFTRVTPQATDTYGPNWFKAETKSGLIFEYGNSTASKQKITGYSQVVNWYVSKISDLYGNQMNFAYIQDNLSVYPAEITYGPNTITFYYKERTDKTYSFLKGVKIEQNLLLDKIVIKYNASVVKTYEFKYAYQGSYYNYYSTLNEIIEYGTGTSRMNSTAITYQVPANVSFSQTLYNTTHAYVTYKSIMVTGDYNGDGKGDFLCLPDASKGATWTGMRVYYGDGNDNFTTYFTETTVLSSLRDIRSLDINGDGRDDIIYETGTTSSSAFYYMLHDGSSFSQPYSITTLTYGTVTGISGKRRRGSNFRQENDNEFSGADYNGDGVNDIFLNNPSGNWRIYSLVNSAGQMTSSLNTLGSGTISTLAREVLSADFNGDGKADIWSYEDTGVKIYTFTGTTLSLLYSSTWPSNKHFFTLGDFNADGKTDVFLYGYGRDGTEYDWVDWQIQLSTGTGFTKVYFPKKKNNLKDDLVRLGDFNGDGATDIMVTSWDMSWNGAWFYISKNKGTDLYSYNIPNYPVASHNFYVADFNGDARTDFICTDGQSAWWNGYQVYKTVGNTSILMEKVGNGLGVLTKLTYTKLSQATSGVYQRGTGASYPVTDFQGPITVVTSTQSDNGVGSMNTRNYYYEGAKIHIQGKGFLAYARTKVTDVASGIENENTFEYYSTYYSPSYTVSYTRRAGTTDLISQTNTSWGRIILDATNKRIFPYVVYSTESNALTGQSVTTYNSYDNYGNPTSVSKVFSNGPTETTTNVYNNTVSSTQWLLGRPTSTTVQHTAGGNTITRTGTRVFSSANNNMTSETWHSGTTSQIVKALTYNTNGTLSSETLTASGVSRTTSYTYESDNIRIKTVTDPLSHVSTNTYDSYGRLLTRKDYLNNTITYAYDNLSRKTSVSSTDGNQTTTAYGWADPASVPLMARYSVLNTGNDGSQTKSWFDKLGREIRSDVKGFNGTWICAAKEYNQKGQVSRTSDPYFSSGTPLWNTYAYDNYGRQTSLSRASGRNSAWAYSSSTVTETTAGKSFTKTYSSDGTVSAATDAGGTITYTYFPDGKVKTITAPGGIVTSMQYDIAGNQIQLVDPSAGTINYAYNGFGELVSQASARNKTTTISYNSDGRISQKVTPEGTTSYTYNSNKQLTSISSPGSVNRSFGYDTKGRVTSVTETIPGSSSLTTSMAYDSYGRGSTITHPSGIIETSNYNSNGYLSSISAGGSTRWTTSSMNERQQVITGQYGSDLGVTYGYDNYGFPASTVTGSLQSYSYNFNPVTGNLNWRQNNKYSNLKETFNYDNLDRLDNVYKGVTSPVMTLDMSYDAAKGGITTKSDVGTLLYNTTGKPYALSSVNPSTGVIPAVLDSVTYTSFESVNTVSEGSYAASFVYNSDNQRAKMEVKQSGSVILARWYPSGSYLKETAGGVTKEYTFIGGDTYSAPVVAITQSGSTTWYYLLRDYLGNITHVVNSTNITTPVAEYSYDAWGRMRVPSTWIAYTPGSEPALFAAGRGYTGHEHLPWFSIINMNGRVYDPLTGQFLNPDNNVQAPDFTQNFNRYSYCLNNPLIYTDPDGESLILLAAIIGGWISMGNAMINSDKDGWGLVGDMFKGLLVGAAAGAAGAWAGGVVAGALGTATTFGGAVANGAIIGASGGFAGGFVGGAGNAWINGADFGQGMQAGLTGGGYGALFGGLIGGISGGIQYQRQISAFQKGCYDLGINGNESVPASDKFLSDAQKVWYKDAPMDRVKAFTVENVPENHLTGKNGLFTNGAPAKTVPLTVNKVFTGNSNVYFNKNLAFSSAKQLFFSMGHEFVHVSQFAALAGQASSLLTQPGFMDLLEFHAYSFSNGLGGGKLSSFTRDMVISFMTKYPSYFNSLSYISFPWTSSVNFSYPF